MRLHDLRAIAEVNFVAVVVRRIVARGDDNAGIRPFLAHRERKLRSRARRGEKADIASEIYRHLRRQLGELSRKMPRIMRDGDLRLCLRALAGEPILEIQYQP